MFKAKRIDSGEVQTVLAVSYHELFHQTYFFVWANDGWRWRPAHNYVPPNVDINSIKEIKTYKEASDMIDDELSFE